MQLLPGDTMAIKVLPLAANSVPAPLLLPLPPPSPLPAVASGVLLRWQPVNINTSTQATATLAHTVDLLVLPPLTHLSF